MPSRYGYMIPRVIERMNMDRAFDEVVDKLPEPRREEYRQRREEIIARLTQQIADGSFRVTTYREMLVKEGPKERLVQSPDVEKRIGCNAIMRIVEEDLYPTIIRTSAASIPGRGMHRLFTKMRHDIENDRDGTKFFWKGDIRKFYESICQRLMWEKVQRKIKDPLLLPILHNFITMMGKGLSIGLRSSQFYGNFLLSGIDHYIKDELGVKYYYRYCDDFVILASSKRKLWLLRDIMHDMVHKLNLEIKANECVRPISDGIDFLGYVYDGRKARLRKRTKQKAARALHRVKSRKRRQEIIGSLKGMAKWGNCKHLYKILTGKKMMEFKDIGLKYVAEDGKKRFTGKPVSLRELANTHITIVDFETDIQTDNGPRTLVSFQWDDGTPGKYFTADKQQLWYLQQMADKGLLPCGTTIKSELFGNNKLKYIFT